MSSTFALSSRDSGNFTFVDPRNWPRVENRACTLSFETGVEAEQKRGGRAWSRRVRALYHTVLQLRSLAIAPERVAIMVAVTRVSQIPLPFRPLGARL